MTHPMKHVPSVNQLAAPLVEYLVDHAAELRLAVSRQDNGVRIVDAGIQATGGIEAGRRIAEICLGGLGRVTLVPTAAQAAWPWELSVSTAQPVLACLGSQYAGWSLSHGEGKGGFFALGSGPGRALAGKEELFAELAYRDRADSACLVLETGKIPPLPLLDKIAGQCDVSPDRLTLILTPTTSLAGSVQVGLCTCMACDQGEGDGKDERGLHARSSTRTSRIIPASMWYSRWQWNAQRPSASARTR